MARYMVTASGPDEPGIVAAVTSTLADLGCNLEDTSMTRLGGYFVMLLVVVDPNDDEADPAQNSLAVPLARAVDHLFLKVTVEPLVESPRVTVVQGEAWAVSLYGADQPGIVAAITEELARVGANVDDLSSRRSQDGDNATYTMLIEVTMPAEVDTKAVVRRLSERAEQMGVTCHARPVDSDTL